MTNHIAVITSSFSLIAMALVLGIRHGFDLDHLATIDSITRSNCINKKFTKLAGILFSLGHGLVVIMLSLLIGLGLIHGQISTGFKIFGNIISIFFLLLFACLTLYNLIITSEKDQHFFGLKTLLFNKLIQRIKHPISIVAIGALFALSFDTLTQIALFSLAATHTAGIAFIIALSTTFMLGMIFADGLNGFLVGYLLSYFNKHLLISKTLSILILVFSLTIGINELLHLKTLS